MMKPIILFKNDFDSEENSIEAHIVFEESNYKTEAQIKVAGFGADKLEAVRQLLEGLNATKEAIAELISHATEVEKLQKEESDRNESKM